MFFCWVRVDVLLVGLVGGLLRGFVDCVCWL